MSDRPTRSLLEFAIAASAAVVPVLLLVLLLVGVLRPGESGTRNADRHVSVRQVAALKTFERAIVRRSAVAIGPPSAELLLDRVPQCRKAWAAEHGIMDRVRATLGRGGAPAPSPAQRLSAQLADLDVELARFSAGPNRRVADDVAFDSARWFDAATAALQVPIEAPDYPGRRFTVQCSDLARAASLLSRSNGRMLPALSWRGTEVERVVSRWSPEQYVEVGARQIARGNPWLGLPGCVYLGGAARGDEAPAPEYYVAGARAIERSACARTELYAAAEAAVQATSPPTGLPGEAMPELGVDDPRWKVPPSLDAMLASLATLRRPSGALYRLYTDAGESPWMPAGYHYGPNRVAVDGTPVDVGFSIDLTIDPSLQELAQKVAACYTGRHDVCKAMGISRQEDAGQAVGQRLLERAMVRMAAIAVIDVESGRIDALAGALSPCTRQEYDGPGRDSRCDRRLPYVPRYRPDALLNPALFHDAMPASVIKPIMAEAFLTDPDVGTRWLAAERAAMRNPGIPAADSLRGQLMRSDSARFLDRMFCADQGFQRCVRTWEVQQVAAQFGWNGGCASPRDDCGKRDLLFGRGLTAESSGSADAGAQMQISAGRIAPLSTPVLYGRLLAEPQGGRLDAPFALRPAIALDAAKVQACAAQKWEKCGGGVVVDVVAEGWGQGHARATALGVAGMFGSLAAAANGQTEVRAPHLVSRIRGTNGTGEGSGQLESAVSRFGLARAESSRLSHDAAEVIMSGLSYSHRAGTARLACEQVFDGRTCREMDWIAGKTGTPTFPNDERSLDELARLCARGGARTKAEQAACGPLRPYKWYVAAYRSKDATERGDLRWTKVIAVLTERNWIRDTGRIHGAGDHGPNPAAEVAMQIAGRDAGYLAGSVR